MTVFHINTLFSITNSSRKLSRGAAMGKRARNRLKPVGFVQVHCLVNGQNFRRMLQAKHLELLQSPWLIELSAFQINTKDSKYEVSCEDLCECSSDFNSGEPTISCKMSETVKAEFNLTCSICLDTVFYPVALGCGHLFCNSCACAAASVPIDEDIKTAKPPAKCPVCRQSSMQCPELQQQVLSGQMMIQIFCTGRSVCRFCASSGIEFTFKEKVQRILERKVIRRESKEEEARNRLLPACAD